MKDQRKRTKSGDLQSLDWTLWRTIYESFAVDDRLWRRKSSHQERMMGRIPSSFPLRVSLISKRVIISPRDVNPIYRDSRAGESRKTFLLICLLLFSIVPTEISRSRLLPHTRHFSPLRRCIFLQDSLVFSEKIGSIWDWEEKEGKGCSLNAPSSIWLMHFSSFTQSESLFLPFCIMLLFLLLFVIVFLFYCLSSLLSGVSPFLTEESTLRLYHQQVSANDGLASDLNRLETLFSFVLNGCLSSLAPCYFWVERKKRGESRRETL